MLCPSTAPVSTSVRDGRPPRGCRSSLTAAGASILGGPTRRPPLQLGRHPEVATLPGRDPTVLADDRPAGRPRCVGDHHHLGGTAPRWFNGRPHDLPSGDRPLAGETSAPRPMEADRRGGPEPVTFTLSLLYGAPGCPTGDLAVRSRPAGTTLRLPPAHCPGHLRSSPGGHRMSTAHPQAVPSSCPAARTPDRRQRAVDRLWTARVRRGRRGRAPVRH